jgi:hypothetical protein
MISQNNVSSFSSPSKTGSIHCRSPGEDIFTSIPGNNAINVITPRVTPRLEMGVRLVTYKLILLGLKSGINKALKKEKDNKYHCRSVMDHWAMES